MSGLASIAIPVSVEDTRKDYGERRIICYGTLAGSSPARGRYRTMEGHRPGRQTRMAER